MAKNTCCEVDLEGDQKHDQKNHNHDQHHNHNHDKNKIDWLLWGSSLVLLFSYLGFLLFKSQIENIEYLNVFTSSIFNLLNKMSWGLALGILFVGVLAKIPSNLILKIFGASGKLSGILKAVLGGVLLDLCSHGILLIGMQLYKKGASLGQTMAFLVASPWNSLSLTFVLWALVGLKWTVLFLLLSMIIGVITGLIFDKLVKRGVLPKNPNTNELPKDFKFWPEAKQVFKNSKFNLKNIFLTFKQGLTGSKMILRWIFFGVVLAGLVRTFISPENFANWFGPTALGLLLTVIAATILEVCSEGSTPIAADILTRAGAPGNSFAFLMTGVSTDYTEILSLKETTKSWKISFFLPLITVPQVLFLAWLINLYI